MRQERKAPVKLLFHSDFTILSHMYYICDKTAKPEWNSNAFAPLHRPTMFLCNVTYLTTTAKPEWSKFRKWSINASTQINTKMNFIHGQEKIFWFYQDFILETVCSQNCRKINAMYSWKPSRWLAITFTDSISMETRIVLLLKENLIKVLLSICHSVSFKNIAMQKTRR